MQTKLKKTIMLFAATAVLVSCVDDLNLSAPTTGKLDEIYFTASIAEQDFFGKNKPQTRSAAAERQRVQAGFYDLAIDGRNDIRLSVSTLDGMFGKPTPMPENGKNNGTTRGAMLAELAQKPMSVIEYAKTSDGKTIVGEPYTAYTEDGSTWGGSHIQQSSNAVSRTLHAIYPSSESYTIAPAAGIVAYTTPESSADQSDLLYATAEQGLGAEQKETVHLTFNHLLTAVRFKVGSQQLPMSVIKSISIDGIATSGTYSFSNSSWDLSKAATGKVSCALNFNVTGAENIVINGGESTFMLLPQQLTSNAKVTIEYQDYTEGEEQTAEVKTLTASLATSSTPAWEAGQCITYTLMDHEGENEYILDVEEPEEFTPAGGTHKARVFSYHKMENGELIPMRWMVQSYSSDGGMTWMSGGATNVPTGMSFSPKEGKSDNGSDVLVQLFPADTVSAPHSVFLRYKTPLGNGGEAFDLSRHDYLNQPCAQTTANCYVVDAPGKYRIPTAYGNAIVDGMTNKDAYTDNAHYDNCETKNNFMTHNGNAITAPMIKNNGINLSRATLVWEDVDKLINPKSIKLVDDGNAIEFEILPENIGQGNAVIAAMDGNTVAWSWHIWVTDEKASLAQPIRDNINAGESVDFMPLTLGWCSTANAHGQIGRELAVRITMPEYLPKRASIRIKQHSTPSQDVMNNVIGNATYYNWGRKDPFPGAVSTETPLVDDENANAIPKPFYQAGTDAAGLGLHAELHTTYGANLLDLFVQGALVGVNGFLTGAVLGKVVKAISAGPKYTVTGINKEKIAGSLMEKPSRLGFSWTRDEAIAALEKAWDAEGGQVEKVVTSVLGEDLTGVTSEWTTIETSPGIMSEGILISKNKVPMYFYGVFEEHLEWGDYIAYMTTVRATSNSATIFLGSFAGIISQGYRQVTIHNATFPDILRNSSLFRGGTDWCKEIKSHGVSVNYGIQHPNILMRDPISWVYHDGVGNLWNASQTKYDDKEAKVVKTIYDPCPAGYCVPSAKDMSTFDDNTTRVDFAGSTVKPLDSGAQLAFPPLGCRNFWDAAEPGAATSNNINEMIFFNGDQGLYWTASPAINKDDDGKKGAYAVNFRGSASIEEYGEKGIEYTPRVVKDLKLQPSFALPIRPVREKAQKAPL